MDGVIEIKQIHCFAVKSQNNVYKRDRNVQLSKS